MTDIPVRLYMLALIALALAWFVVERHFAFRSFEARLQAGGNA